MPRDNPNNHMNREIDEILVRAKLDEILGTPQTAPAEFARSLTTAHLLKNLSDEEVAKLADWDIDEDSLRTKEPKA